MALPRATPIQPYRFHEGEWVPARAEPEPGHSAARPGDVRLATLNMLADCFPRVVELAIASPERHAALVGELAGLDATILALNEVTPTGLAMLLNAPFVRANYYVTELPGLPNGTIRSHGCVLLSKVRFDECHAMEPDQPRGRKAIVGVFSIEGLRIAVCALHTVAFQTPEAKAVRATQIARVDAFLCSLGTTGGHFIVGDLNMHYVSEDAVVTANSLLDLWAETHFGASGDGDLGYTFDTQTNSMIGRYIPAESRRMRLDRMLCSEGAALAPTAPVRLWASTAVDARRQIFISDHYGLVVDLAAGAAAGLRGDPAVARVLAENASVPDGPEPFSRLRFAAALASHVPWLALRAAGWW